MTDTTLHDRLLALADKPYDAIRDVHAVAELCREAAAALEVRSDFVLVPREPTEAMYAAAQAISKPRFGLLTSSEMWSAMIAAAPQPPENA